MNGRAWFSVLLLSACGGGAAATTTSTPPPAPSFAELVARTEARLAGTQAFEVEYEEHGGRRVIEVEVIAGEAVHAVFYDPATGDIVDEADESPEGDELPALPALRDAIAQGSLSLGRAVELATSRYGEGAVEAVELVSAEGAWAVAILVRQEAGMTRLLLDPASGELLSSGPGSAEHAEP